jgi:hypothetical protein
MSIVGTIRLLNRNMHHDRRMLEVVAGTVNGETVARAGEIPLSAALELIEQGEACWVGEAPLEPLPPVGPDGKPLSPEELAAYRLAYPEDAL